MKYLVQRKHSELDIQYCLYSATYTVAWVYKNLNDENQPKIIILGKTKKYSDAWGLIIEHVKQTLMDSDNTIIINPPSYSRYTLIGDYTEYVSITEPISEINEEELTDNFQIIYTRKLLKTFTLDEFEEYKRKHADIDVYLSEG